MGSFGPYARGPRSAGPETLQRALPGLLLQRPEPDRKSLASVAGTRAIFHGDHRRPQDEDPGARRHGEFLCGRETAEVCQR